MSVDFGTLRSLLNQPATPAAWEAICEELGRVEPEQDEAFDDEVRPYCEAMLKAWPRDVERRLSDAMTKTLQKRRPHRALALIDHLELSHLKAAALRQASRSVEQLGPLRLLRKLTMTYCELTDECLEVWVKALEGAGLDSLTLQRLEVEPPQVATLKALIGSPLAAQLRELDLSCSGVADVHIAELVKAKALERLEVLDLSLAFHVPLTLAALGDEEALPKLRRLVLIADALDDEQVEALIMAPRPELSELSLRNNKLTALTMRRLAQDESLLGLRSLDLWHNQIDAVGLGVLFGSSRMAQLEALHLGLNVMADPRVVAAQLSCAHAPKLRLLSLNDLKLEAEHVAQLAASEVLAGVEQLELSRNAIGTAGAQALASSPHLSKLRTLLLNRCQIGAKGVEALMKAPWVSQLERLDLSNNPIGDGGARAIAASPCERLRVLELDYCRRLTEVGAQALAKSATLPEVVRRKFERDGGA